MKFGQLTEYNEINIFLEESYTKCCRETIPWKIQIEQISGSIAYSFIQFVFIVCQVDAAKRYWNYNPEHSLLPQNSIFKKTKVDLELVYLPHFLHDFWIKIFY